jgi:glycosyltransferase involved in cell wall biosynthesis
LNRICAIVPTYNRGEMLAECLNSIVNQVRKPDEIVVVNDGSTDNTSEVLERYGNQIRVISKKNAGKSSAINAALNETECDFIWIVDDDDYADENGLLKLEKALDSHSDVGFAFGAFNRFFDSNDGRTFLPASFWARPEEPNWEIAFLERMFTFQPAMLVKRAAYERVGFFDTDFLRSQDYEMTLRLLKEFKCAFVPDVIFHQREHAGVRGPAADRFSASESARRWLKYDQLIFRKVWAEFVLERFTPTFALEFSPERRQRAALIQRAGIMARRGLWELAVEDLVVAAGVDTDGASFEEINLAEKLVDQELAWAELSKDKALLKTIRRLQLNDKFASDIFLAFTRPVIWQAKNMALSEGITPALKHLKLLVEVLGLRWAVSRIWLSLKKPSNLQRIGSRL